MNKITFLLDTGHGIDTAGKRSPKWDDGTQLFEWQFNRQVVSKIISLCSKESINTVYITSEDKDIGLKERVERADRYICAHPKEKCVYVSIHGNGFNNENANGIEVWTSPGQTRSDKVAEVFYQEATKLGWRMRSDMSDGDHDKESRFYVLMETVCPAILTENGFYTNKEECKKMMSREYQWKLAQAHVDCFKRVIKENTI